MPARSAPTVYPIQRDPDCAVPASAFRPTNPSSLQWIGAVVALTMGVRGLVYWMTPDAFQADPDAYRAIATTIEQSGVFGLTGDSGTARPIAFRPPLYPWLLSWFVNDGQLAPWSVALLHTLLATITSVLTFITARRLCGSNAAAAAAAALTGLDPVLVRQSTELMTETLATCLATAVIALWVFWEPAPDRRSRWSMPAGMGLLLAAAYLCRPTFLVWAGLLTAAAAVRFRQPHTPQRAHWRRPGWQQAGVVAGVVAIAVAGWTARNDRVLGQPIWATTHGGYTLLLANNESFYDYLHEAEWGQAWDARPFLSAYQHRYNADPREADFWNRPWETEPQWDPAATEYSDDRLSYESAVATIKRRPGDFGRAAIVRVARLWSPLPHDVQGRSGLAVLAAGCFFILIDVAIVIACFRHRKTLFASRFWAIWLLAITLSGVHAVYWSNLRMRAPAVPAMAMIAVCAGVKPEPRQKS